MARAPIVWQLGTVRSRTATVGTACQAGLIGTDRVEARDPERTPHTVTARTGVGRISCRTVVKWERDGHTCVLSIKAVRLADLLMPADWRGKSAIPFRDEASPG